MEDGRRERRQSTLHRIVSGSSGAGKQMNADDESTITELLMQWAYGHPAKDEPFLFFMGEALTPIEFFEEVRERTDRGESFLRFISEQGGRSRTDPANFIRRAI